MRLKCHKIVFLRRKFRLGESVFRKKIVENDYRRTDKYFVPFRLSEK